MELTHLQTRNNMAGLFKPTSYTYQLVCRCSGKNLRFFDNNTINDHRTNALRTQLS